ncbi:MAG: hypothetical protein IKP28_01440 [Clostridia bacterium]|nr:hypothetical protein [Clostridia bacterium]
MNEKNERKKDVMIGVLIAVVVIFVTLFTMLFVETARANRQAALQHQQVSALNK